MKIFDPHGQVLVEFILSFALVVCVLVGVASLFRTEWQRAKCAYWVFERVHAERIGAQVSRSGVYVQMQWTDDGVVGEGQCGSVQERVELPFLESAQW